MMEGLCSVCRASLPSTNQSQFVICAQCGCPSFIGDSASPFEVFNIEKKFHQNESAISQRYYELSKLLHPDRYIAMDNVARIKIQQLSALLNQAYVALKSPESRLETLLKAVGALKDSERSVDQKKIPSDLAEEYFEIQEASMEAAPNTKDLIAIFRTKLEAKKRLLTEEMQKLALTADWSNSAKTQHEIDTIVDLRLQRSYLRSMLDNLERLERQ